MNSSLLDRSAPPSSPPVTPARPPRGPWMIRFGIMYFSRIKALLLLGDVAILWAVFIFCALNWYGLNDGWIYTRESLVPTSLTIAIYVVTLYIADFYNPRDDYLRARKLVLAYVAGIIVTLFGSSFFYFVGFLRLSRMVLMMQLLIAPLLLLLWRLLIYRAQQTRRAVILGGPAEARLFQNLLREFRFSEFTVIAAYGSFGEFQKALPALRQEGLDTVVHSLSWLDDQEFLDFLSASPPEGLEIYSLPELYEWLSGKVPCEAYPRNLLVMQLLGGRRTYRMRVKRLVDVFCSLLLLLFSMPILLVCAILIKLTSRGPVFYRQARVGTQGRVFHILKFRTMTVMETEGAMTAATAADPRVTSVGRFLRKIHLDEVPQLINVLKGEMAFVGPRPWVYPCMEEWDREIPFYSLRTLVPQGITGWAQVNHHYPGDTAARREALAYDLYYIKNFSMLIDLRVLLRTVRTILSSPSR